MSWFDAKQITSFAKTALNEAQKTLDKALDIQEEEERGRTASSKTSKVSQDDTNTAETLGEDEDRRSSMSSVASQAVAQKVASLAIDMSSQKLWGSFTGSFFDASQLKDKPDQDQPNSPRGQSLPPPTPATEVVISSQPSSSALPPRNITTTPPPGLAFSSVETSSVGSSSAVMEEANADDLEALDSLAQSSSSGMIENLDPSPTKLDKNGFSQSQLLVETNTLSSSEGSKQDLDSSMSSSALTMTTVEPDENETIVVPDELPMGSNALAELNTLNEGNVEEVIQDTSENLASMLTDAMTEQEKRSETSSSKSYEVVKAGSFPTSGHTSGDEFETTTTSSDIEVISSPSLVGNTRNGSPNGKSSHSGQRSYSVTTGNDSFNRNHFHHSRMGHNRTGSELSTAGSEESSGNNSHEVERLLKRISELNEVLEIRETKMVELSRSNLELQEKNVDLGSQVKEAMKINAKLNESVLSSEDFTNRLSGMEKKLQKALAEKDTLSQENAKLKKESSGRMSQEELSSLLEEKDEIIEDLRSEGEKLSKQVGKHSDIIKKLRTKEKANEKEIKKLKKELEETKSENERLTKSLNAKDEVETKQIEAITNLTSANSKWEEEHNKVKSDLEDSLEKVASLKTSLESAYREIAELKRGLMEKEGEAQEIALSKEMAAKRALQEQLRELQEDTRKEKENLFLQIDQLRDTLSSEERASSRREEQLRRERDDLLARLEQSENRHEELSGSVSAATRPLLRQIESLQANLNETQTASERVERSLSERLQQASIQLAAAQERERTAAEQYMLVSSKTASLESKLNLVIKEKTELEALVEQESQKRQALEEQKAKSTASIETMKRSFAEEVDELKRERDFLEASLDSEKCDLSAEKRKNLAIAEQLKERDKRLKDIQTELDLTRSTRNSSPTPSLSQLSINGSVSEGYSMNPWPDEVFENSSTHSRFGLNSSNVYDSVRNAAPSTALLESLQSQLKLKEGELMQLQVELSHLERSKNQLTAEVTRLNDRAEKMDSLEEELDQFKKGFVALEQKYQTMLTMYGEKVEEAEELRLDLADVKEMYKTQIQELIQAGKQ